MTKTRSQQRDRDDWKHGDASYGERSRADRGGRSSSRRSDPFSRRDRAHGLDEDDWNDRRGRWQPGREPVERDQEALHARGYYRRDSVPSYPSGSRAGQSGSRAGSPGGDGRGTNPGHENP